VSGVDDGGLRMRDRGPSKLSGPKFPELNALLKEFPVNDSDRKTLQGQ
jgi:hypothetical protein